MNGFQTHPLQIKSPSIPPLPTHSSFSTPGTWPRPPHPETSRPSSPGIKRTSPVTRVSGRSSPVKDPLPLVSSRNCTTQSSSIPQYSDLLRRELDSRFLSATPGLAPILPPPLAPPQGTKLMDSPLFRPLIPSIGLTGLSSPYSALPTGLTPPVPPHSVSYTPTSTHALTSGSLVPPPSGGMLGNLSGIGLPPVSSVQTLPSKSKPGRWNAMHVRLAWEIYRNQQRQQRDQQPDQKKNPNLMPKFNPGPLPPPPKLGGPFEMLSNPLTPHSSSFGFTPHSVAGFLPRLPSASNQHSTPPPPQPPQSIPPQTVRLSPAPEQWNRLPRSSPMPFSAPWLAPLVPSGPSSSSIKVEASSSASTTTNHMLMKERERQKREEREREREREREKERSEKLEREKERERERRRHASRSPITIRTSTNGPVKTESTSNPKVTYSLSNVLPSIPPFHPELSQPQPPTTMPSSILDRSRLGLPMTGLYGQSFDPFRDVLRGIDLRESLDREQREFMRFAPPGHLLPTPPSLNPALFPPPPPPHSAATGGADRYRDFVGMAGLSSDRFRDGLQLPSHLGHMTGPLGIPLGGPPGGSLNDRYREGLLSTPIPGMSGPSLFPPVSTSFQYPPGLGPPSLLGSSLGPPLPGGGLSSLAMLPPSLLTPGGKRTPPPPTSLTSSLTNPLVSLSRTHMGMVPPTLGLSPYPLPSPSPMLNPHLIPSLTPSLSNTRPPSTPPVGRSLLDLQPPLPAGLPTYNPLDYPRKDDPQSR